MEVISISFCFYSAHCPSLCRSHAGSLLCQNEHTMTPGLKF